MGENRAKKAAFDSIKQAGKTGEKVMDFYLQNDWFPILKYELKQVKNR